MGYTKRLFEQLYQDLRPEDLKDLEELYLQQLTQSRKDGKTEKDTSGVKGS